MIRFSYLLFLVIFLFSCSEDPLFCDTADCGANGTCDEITKTCVCDPYYEGEFCSDEIRTKFIGNWFGMGVCTGNTFDIDVSITPGIEINEIKIQSVDILQSFIMTGMVEDNNTVVIPEFQSNLGTNLYDGKIDYLADSTILITLNAYVGTDISTCTYNLSM